MSEEAPLVVVKELKKNKFIGGAGIVALHLKKMSSNLDSILKHHGMTSINLI